MSDLTMNDYLSMHPALDDESENVLGERIWVFKFDKIYMAQEFAIRIASESHSVTTSKRLVIVTECKEHNFGELFAKDFYDNADMVI